jgi:ubiquinone/menaquinone biosynthesis C-methylase UbiE
MTQDVYTHGHHESVLRSHKWRTAANSAAYLRPSLRAGLDLLDVGCGPGTITADLARLVEPGRTVAVDRASEVVAQARADTAARGIAIEFAVADVYALPYVNGSFDVVHAHQVLQHLTDPVGALREMRRLLRPGGLLAARDSDYACFAWAPNDPMLRRWLDVYSAVARRNAAEPDAGRFLKGWAIQAGFRDVRASSSTWTYADPESCAWWGSLWAERCERSSLAVQAVAYGISSAEELRTIADAFRAWAVRSDAYFMVPHGEILAYV